MMNRGPLVLTLALASLGRLAGRPGTAPAGVPQQGRAASVVPENGALLVETDGGAVLLILAWDATITGAAGAMALADIRVGDAVQWTSSDAQTVVMVDQLRVVPAAGR
jgi:hypothetical protein